MRLTAKKRMRATLTAIREKLYQRRHEPVVWAKKKNSSRSKVWSVADSLVKSTRSQARRCFNNVTYEQLHRCVELRRCLWSNSNGAQTC